MKNNEVRAFEGFSSLIVSAGLGLMASLFSVGALAAEANATTAATFESNVVRLADDFFVAPASSNFQSRFHRSRFATPLMNIDERSACEQSLRKAVCETTAATNQISRNPESVPCAADSDKYLPNLMEIYDETPEKMRLSLCTLEKIFISENITSTAFASALTNNFGQIVGGFVGFKKGSFVQQPSSHALVSWKEQLAFGGSTEFLSNDPNLVQIDYALKLTALKTDGLFYVLMHELGHLIDFKNQVNSRFAATEWSRLSWKTSNVPLATAAYELQDQFCFYDCDSYLKADQAPIAYSSLQKSAFITTYSGVNNYEDFAEFWVWHLMLEFKDPKFTITMPGFSTLDMTPVFTDNPQIKTKLNFVDNLWNSPSLVIDNRAQ